MNENLNLYEILKDCPKGTKLWSSVWGDNILRQGIASSGSPRKMKVRLRKVR